MLIALYEMKVKAGKELEFEDAWAKSTDAIYRVRGSFTRMKECAESIKTLH